MSRLLWVLLAVNAILALVGHVLFAAESVPGTRRVALVFDVGGKDDKSFNESAWRGVLRGEQDFGIAVQTVEPGDGSDRESALRQFAAAKYDLVIGVGFIFSHDLRELARQYPETKFACIDYSPGLDAPDNLAAIRFREHEGSFLAGVASGSVADRQAKSGGFPPVVGFVGGMKIPLIEKFEAGYRAGVAASCPDCRVLVAYAGTEPKAFADPSLGYELAKAQFHAGAQVLFHASGKTGDGVIAAAADVGRKVIGVDSDQYDLAPCCVMTSMLKRVDEAVYRLLQQLHRGEFRGGVFELGLAEGGVGLLADARNWQLYPPELRRQVDAYAQAIIAGTQPVPSHVTTAAGPTVPGRAP